MSLFFCDYCARYRDTEFHGCVGHPDDECVCICEDCAQRAECYNYEKAMEENCEY